MFYREKEGPVFDIDEKNTALKRGGKGLSDQAKTLLLPQFRVEGMVEQMVKYRVHVFHVFIIASVLLLATGCGHKGPPYYPHDKNQEASR